MAEREEGGRAGREEDFCFEVLDCWDCAAGTEETMCRLWLLLSRICKQAEGMDGEATRKNNEI